jgi:hypothetical protein
MSSALIGAVYHGYVVVPETFTDGWCLGTMSEYQEPAGCTEGDAFVVAPDGSRADLVWDVGVESLQEILPPGPDRWGVYAVSFPRAIRTVDDLVKAFRSVLPQLQSRHAQVRQ